MAKDQLIESLLFTFLEPFNQLGIVRVDHFLLSQLKTQIHGIRFNAIVKKLKIRYVQGSALWSYAAIRP